MSVAEDQSGPSHANGQGQAHAPADFGKAFLIGILLNSGFVAVEAGYGFAAHSMALLADAGHNLSDVLGLAAAWTGAVLVKRRPSPRFSYGLKKSSILAALFNGLLLFAATGAIIAEAIRRLAEPAPSNGSTIMVVAGIGILVNAVTAWLFARGRSSDLNIRGAFLHMVSDAAVSAAVVVAGYLITVTGKTWIDPVASLAVAGVILWSCWGLLVEATSMTLAGVPKGVDPQLVEKALKTLEGVNDVHHLHIWSLSTIETALTVHLVLDAAADGDRVIRQANAYVHQLFEIGHSTIQVERSEVAPCR